MEVPKWVNDGKTLYRDMVSNEGLAHNRRFGILGSGGYAMTTTMNKTKQAKAVMPENDPWHAHNTSSHIPNAELRKVLEESEAGINMETATRAELKKLWK
jgi:uncharacterized protein YcbX